MSTDLHGLVRQVITDHAAITSPRELAKCVVAATPRKEMAALYEQALVSVVGDVMRQGRNAALAQGRNASPHPGHSPKYVERRSWWQRMLNERLHIGNGEWKPIADATAEDLKFCVRERLAQITELKTAITTYERLLELLAEHDVATVGELPEQDQL